MRFNFRCVLPALAMFAASGSLEAQTFSKDVAPIIFSRCTSCHRPGEAAPFALQSYDDVRKRAELIEHVVTTKLMPPWKAESGDARFHGDRRLSESDVTILTTWIRNGMPEGDSRDLPLVPRFPQGWQLGQPDLILTMPEAYIVRAEGPDIYRSFVLPTGLTAERWVRAIEFRPSSRTVVHHSLFFADATGRARQKDLADPEPGFRGGMRVLGTSNDNNNDRRLRGALLGGRPNLLSEGSLLDGNSLANLGGWAVGAQPQLLPRGLAYQLPADADLVLATHFHPSGKEEREASTIGLYFADAAPQKGFTGIQLPPAFGALKGIDIPAGAKEYAIEDQFVLPVDVEAFSVSAHAHYLGKSMTMTAWLPDGQRKTLLSIPQWDFAWQEQYEFEEFVPLPKGTRLHTRITYDNSSDNPNNPFLPPRRVRFGQESTDEMGSMTLRVVAANEQELPRLKAAYQSHLRDSFRKAPLLKTFLGRSGLN